MKETKMISIEEFSQELNVSRTTVFEWMKNGKLVQGQHYLKFGRVIRFPWGDELIQALVSDSLQISPKIKINSKPVKPETPGPLGTVIDLDYR